MEWVGLKRVDGTYDTNRTPGVNEKSWWRCKEGHEWESRYSSLGSGGGCPYCSGTAIYNLVVPEVVRDYFQKNKLNQGTYAALSKADKLPEGFPGDPAKVYQKPWSWFSGNNDKNQIWVKPKVVRDYTQKNKLNQATYTARSKADKLPEGFPGNPAITYQKPWSWFSGNNGKNQIWVKPEVVRDYTQKNKLTLATYAARSKADKLPEGFPSNPDRSYQKPWSWFSGRSRGINSKKSPIVVHQGDMTITMPNPPSEVT